MIAVSATMPTPGRSVAPASSTTSAATAAATMTWPTLLPRWADGLTQDVYSLAIASAPDHNQGHAARSGGASDRAHVYGLPSVKPSRRRYGCVNRDCPTGRQLS